MAFIDHITKSNKLPKGACHEDIQNRMQQFMEQELSPEYLNQRQHIVDTVPYLLDCIFGNSQFLSQLIIKQPDALFDLLYSEPMLLVQNIIADILSLDISNISEAELVKTLRVYKQKIALITAITDLSGYWNLEQVTNSLSDFAEASLKVATSFVLYNAGKQGHLTLKHPDKPAKESGFIIIAMGKLGARELNYSSDIDLILFYEPELIQYNGNKSVQHFLNRITQQLVSIINDKTPDGYVFRVDLRLRPDPASTPVIVSIPAALAYYERVGQNWERMALIKARSIAGDIQSGQQFIDDMKLFIWRKYLDFAMIEDIHSVKRQIDNRQKHVDPNLYNYNIKIGKGGIREIEFFAAIQQLIWGGRYARIQTAATCESLLALAECEKITYEVVNELIKIYTYLRILEHRLQMVNDQQTHSLPDNEHQMNNIAIFMGYDDTDSFISDLKKRLNIVQQHYNELCGESQTLGSDQGNLVFTGTENDPETIDNINSMGFSNGAVISDIIRSWHHAKTRATRSQRARELLTELVPTLLESFSNTNAPLTAFIKFNEILSRLPAGVQLFSLFIQNPQLINLVADITGSYPFLSDQLSRKPLLIDYVLSPDFLVPISTEVNMHETLNIELDTARHYEELLDIARHWTHDRQFRVGVQFIQKIITPEEARKSLSEIADSVLSGLLNHVKDEFTMQYGDISKGEFVVIALGKLGSNSLNFGSDVDLTFVYDSDDFDKPSDGENSIYANQYYSRLSRRYISSFSVLTSEGILYEVDTRLRPSGADGPIASTLRGFNKYYDEMAWTWEYMALTRARVLGGDGDLCGKIQDNIKALLCKKRDSANLARDVLDIRDRIEQTYRANNIWNLKYMRGGIIDIEFIAQFLQLKYAHQYPEILQQDTGEALRGFPKYGILNEEISEYLANANCFLLDLQTALRLTSGTIKDNIELSPAIQQGLIKLKFADDFVALQDKLSIIESTVMQYFNQIIAKGTL